MQSKMKNTKINNNGILNTTYILKEGLNRSKPTFPSSSVTMGSVLSVQTSPPTLAVFIPKNYNFYLNKSASDIYKMCKFVVLRLEFVDIESDDYSAMSEFSLWKNKLKNPIKT